MKKCLVHFQHQLIFPASFVALQSKLFLSEAFFQGFQSFSPSIFFLSSQNLFFLYTIFLRFHMLKSFIYKL